MLEDGSVNATGRAIPNVEKALRIAYDPHQQRVYWSDVVQCATSTDEGVIQCYEIKSAYLNGTDVKTVLETGKSVV